LTAKKDSLGLGLALGFLTPMLAMLGYYFIKFYNLNVTLSQFWYLLMENRSFLTGLSSIALVANAVLFTIFINTRRDQTAKGVFVATLVYGIGVLVVKLLQ
jgi:tryptophan-rich sensory protein